MSSLYLCIVHLCPKASGAVVLHTYGDVLTVLSLIHSFTTPYSMSKMPLFVVPHFASLDLKARDQSQLTLRRKHGPLNIRVNEWLCFSQMSAYCRSNNTFVLKVRYTVLGISHLCNLPLQCVFNYVQLLAACSRSHTSCFHIFQDHLNEILKSFPGATLWHFSLLSVCLVLTLSHPPTPAPRLLWLALSLPFVILFDCSLT